jgi:hypothetical protein
LKKKFNKWVGLDFVSDSEQNVTQSHFLNFFKGEFIRNIKRKFFREKTANFLEPEIRKKLKVIFLDLKSTKKLKVIFLGKKGEFLR